MSDILVKNRNLNSFEPSPHIESDGFAQSYDSIDMTGGIWYSGTASKTLAAVTDVGSSSARFLVADYTAGTIGAQASAPDTSDLTKQLLLELIFATYVVGINEIPDNPPWSGQSVITSWKRHQYGDIIRGVILPAGGLQYQVLQKVDGTDYNVAWYWVRAHA